MKKLNQDGFIGSVVVAAVVVMIILGIVLAAKAIGGAIDRKNSERGRGDAQVGKVDNEPRTVYQMPDRFGNVSVFCDEYGNAVYTTTSDPNRSLHTLKDGCE